MNGMMHDSVETHCPECGDILKLDSEAGECQMVEYNQENIPVCIAEDLDGKEVKCSCCGAKLICLTETVVIFRLKKKR